MISFRFCSSCSNSNKRCFSSSCLRSFHLGCLSEDVQESILNDVNNTKKWLCEDCENNSYECNLCHNYGTLYHITGDKESDKKLVFSCY